MVDMGRDALVKVIGVERQDDGTHPGQVIDTKVTRASEGACCSPHPTGLNQGFNGWQLAMG